MNREARLYVGTYCAEHEVGIYGFRMEPGRPELLTACEGAVALNPSYLVAAPESGRLYAVLENMTYEGQDGGAVAAFDWAGHSPGQEHSLRLLGTKSTRGTLPCHLLVDEQQGYLFTANYMSGSVSMFRLEPDGAVGELCDFKQHVGHGPNQERQEGPHVHYIGAGGDGRGIRCVDLGLDRICYYEVDAEHSRLTARTEKDIVLPAGSGPRHFVRDQFRPDILYVVCELSSEVITIFCGEEGGRIGQRISTLPPGVTDSTCAAIRLSADGRYLYASNRGHDSIAVFRVDEQGDGLTLVEIVKTAGAMPRDFIFWNSLLFIANQASSTITVFHADEVSGRIHDSGQSVRCQAPVSLVVV